MQILNLFGAKVRSERLRKGLSQEDLAFRSGLHRTYIGMIERAEKNVTLSNIYKISRALEIPIYELLKYDEIDETE